MDKNFVNLPVKNKKFFSWKKSPIGFKILLITVFEIVYLFINWKIFRKIDFREASPMDLFTIISVAIFGGLILAFYDNFGEAMSFLFYQPLSNPWIKAFYVFVAISFIVAILLIVFMLIFYQKIFCENMFIILFYFFISKID